MEKARDAALSTANRAHAQAGEKLGPLDGVLGESDDQMLELKGQDADDSHDEILDRETVWENYENELLTFTALEAGSSADSTESTWVDWLKWVIPFWGTLSGWSERFDRRAAEHDRLATVIARGDFDSVDAMQQARINALAGATEGLHHASALQAEVGTEVAMTFLGGLSGAADDAFRWADDVGPRGRIVKHHSIFKALVKPGRQQKLYKVIEDFHVGQNGLHTRLLRSPYKDFMPTRGRSLKSIIAKHGAERWLQKQGEAIQWLERTYPGQYTGLYDAFLESLKRIGGAEGIRY